MSNPVKKEVIHDANPGPSNANGEPVLPYSVVPSSQNASSSTIPATRPDLMEVDDSDNMGQYIFDDVTGELISPNDSLDILRDTTRLTGFLSSPRDVDPTMYFCVYKCSQNSHAPFKCPACGRGRFTEFDLKKHIHDTHPYLSDCALCPEAGNSVLPLVNHVKAHLVPVTKHCYCIFCGFMLTYYGKHEHLQHLLFQCPNISKCMICKEQLDDGEAKRHRDIAHFSTMHFYGCSQCYAFFPSLDYLVDHVCKERIICRCNPTVVYDSLSDLERLHLAHVDNRYHSRFFPLHNRHRHFFVYNELDWSLKIAGKRCR